MYKNKYIGRGKIYVRKNNQSGWRENKWIRGAIPALLLHMSIGTVYCWSIFSQEIANYIGWSKSATEWAFSFAISIAFTALTIITGGIKNSFVDGSSNILLVSIVLCLLFAVNAGYGGGFSNVPNLLSDHYGMSNISAIHGITLSAWAIAGLTGNQMANAIVNSVASKHPELLREVEYHGEMITVNPVGYQTVLYVTGALYVVSLLLSIFLVRPSEAALAAKKAKAK